MYKIWEYTKSQPCDQNRYRSFYWAFVHGFGGSRDGSFRLNALVLQYCRYEDAKKVKTFKYTEKYMDNVVAQSVLSMLFFHFKRHSIVEINEVAYENVIRFEVRMKRFWTDGNQSIGTSRKYSKH